MDTFYLSGMSERFYRNVQDRVAIKKSIVLQKTFVKDAVNWTDNVCFSKAEASTVKMYACFEKKSTGPIAKIQTEQEPNSSVTSCDGAKERQQQE
jgi:hypothetical protein